MKTFFFLLMMSIYSASSTRKFLNSKKIKNSVATILLTLQLSPLPYSLAADNSMPIDQGEIGFLRPPPVTTRQKLIRASESILTNPILENLRKSDQLDDDETDSQSAKALSLIPILSIKEDIDSIKLILRDKSLNEAKLQIILGILKNDVYTPSIFKKTFNKYSDNIYYSDPRRANLYLGGGTTPTTQQTSQYLLRNDMLTSFGNIKSDIETMLKEGISVDEFAIADAIDDCEEAETSMKQYLALAEPSDLDAARKVMSTGKVPNS